MSNSMFRAGRLLAASALLSFGACGGGTSNGEAGDAGVGESRTVWFVDALATAGGDGSAGAPFATLAEAIDAAQAGAGAEAEFRMAVGTYDVPADVAWDQRPLRFFGANVDDTQLRFPEGFAPDASVFVQALALTSNEEVLRIDGQRWVLDSASIRGTRLRVSAQEVELLGLRVENGGLSVVGGALLVRDAQFDDAFLRIEGVTDADVMTLSFEEGPGPLLQLVDTTGGFSDISAQDAGTRNGERLTAEQFGAEVGQGILVQGGDVVADDWSVIRSVQRGVNVRAGTLRGGDVRIAGAGLTGMSGQQDAVIDLDELQVEAAGIAVFGSGAQLTLRSATVTDGSDGCVLVSDGSQLLLVDSTLSDCPSGHVSSLGEGTSVEVRDNTIIGAAIESCIAVSGTGETLITGNEVRDCAGAGISVFGPNAEVTFNQVSGIRESPIVPGVIEGISVLQSSPRVANNVVRDFEGAGIALLNAGGTIEDNELFDLGDVGIRAIERGDEPVIIRNNQITRASVAGIAALTVDATIEGNSIQETRFIAAEQSGEGIAAGVDADVVIVDNEVIASERSGIFLLAPVEADVRGNDLRDNATVGVRCAGGEVPLGENTFAGNGEGDTDGC